jgi:hypothetical protein
MISFEIYKILHLFGIALLLLGLGAILGAFAMTPKVSGKVRMLGFVAHGLGLLIALTGGFGMAARMGLVSGLPLWIYLKLGVWAVLAIGVSIAKRKANWSFALVGFFAGLVALATYFAIFKPT